MAMSEAPHEELVRTQDFVADGPVELDLGITVGRIDVLLSDTDSDTDSATGGDEAARTVSVELREDPSSASPWVHGLASTLSWITEQFGDQFGAELSTSTAEAVSQTRIDMVGRRLVVHTPKQLPLRHIPLALTVRAPAGSRLEVKTGSARVTTTGTAGRADVATSSGDVAFERATDAVSVRTGGGSVSLGPTPGGLHVRTGGGDVRAADVRGSATMVTGTGSVRIGSVTGDLVVRSGTGELSVSDAASGSVNLRSGTGSVRIGVRSGVLAEVDLSSGAGTVSSELDVADTPPEGDVPLRIKASTGSGNAVITAAEA
ncbi:MAG: hypothetical protein GEU86_07895 [Actinophytocola sp.]|nr:hypothetical protein [Actinophytocola sp.]